MTAGRTYLRDVGDGDGAAPYTRRVNIVGFVAGIALGPVRAGVAVADAGLNAAVVALGVVKQSVGVDGTTAGGSITELVPLRGALVGANRVAEFTERDRALGRALAPGGPADQLMRPGGVVDLLTSPGGLLDRLGDGGTSSLERILTPGGLADRLIAEEGPLERLLAEDGIVERIFAEEGVIDKLLAKNGPLDQLTDAAEILSKLQPAFETLMPTAETLESAVDSLNRMVATLGGFAERIPRRRSSRSAVRAKRSADLPAIEE